MLMAFSLISRSQEKLVKTEIGEHINILLPESFITMSEEDYNTKFVSSKAPLAIYTNQQRTVEFSINESNTTWTERDLELMKSFYKSSIQSLYDKISIINESIEEINKRKFVIFEFTSRINPEEDAIVKQKAIQKYSFIQYTIFEGKTTLFHFSAPSNELSYWQPTMHSVMNSVKIK